MEPTNSAARPPWKTRSKEASTTTSTTTTIQALSPDILCIIFSFVDLFDLVRLSAVCKSWSARRNRGQRKKIETELRRKKSGISTLCFNPSSHLLFAGSFAGHASCWDLRRTRKPVWETRVSPNVIHSIHHLRNDTRTFVMGGIDGVLRVADQQTGEVVSRYIIEGRSSSSSVPGGSRRLVERKKARRIAENTRLDLMPRTSRPYINCVTVGMQKVVTTHPDNYVRVWKFDK
ncbi:hypothetical protein RJ639_006400 [Escallonia herrerae]|uniref:F-box domain-containing protein n=1 Tax=Escallonia herrerae TaxID=1293975 RepID=A0AA89AZQ3_9ASTE|nr:hypothetical protein RJ639_006400 [Escallonia herrerae]